MERIEAWKFDEVKEVGNSLAWLHQNQTARFVTSFARDESLATRHRLPDQLSNHWLASGQVTRVRRLAYQAEREGEFEHGRKFPQKRDFL